MGIEEPLALAGSFQVLLKVFIVLVQEGLNLLLDSLVFRRVFAGDEEGK
jgi:hypothetical protein